MKDQSKISDHHFKSLNGYKYNLIETDPSKSYEELEMLKLCESIIKTALQLHQKKTHEFAKGGIVNNEGPEMVVNSKEESKNKAWCDFREGTYLAWKEKNEP